MFSTFCPTRRVFAFLGIFSCVLFTSSAVRAQRVIEGPRTSPNTSMRTYRIGDERIRYIVRTVEGPNFDVASLAAVAKRYTQEAMDKDSVTHAWDNKWYFFPVPNVAERKKYLLVIAHNVVRGEIGWVAAVNEGNRWTTLNNEGVSNSLWNGQGIQYLFYFNGHRVDLNFYNPHEGGWTANDIFYKISDPLDPRVRLRDDETYKF